MVNSWDVVVVGGGHSGIEAALAACRMGLRTLMVTLNIDLIGQMSCNPSVGGIGKGHIVAEIEAMGGAMGRLADMSGLQFRMLNTRKGYAVQALRVQTDRYRYRDLARRRLESFPGLSLRQGEVVGVERKGSRVEALVLHDETRISARSFVLTTGTFLSGILHQGFSTLEGGRAGDRASRRLSAPLSGELGLQLGRLKTGTPPRLSGKTIDWSKMIIQPGDEPPSFFSGQTRGLFYEGGQIPCHLTRTTARTSEIIRENLDRSPLYSGKIKGIGPRYCPSIEDKIVKFPDRDSHHIFIEPEGLGIDEVYPNGISTSLPVDVQEQIVGSIPGLERAVIMRPGYAVEYDFVFPDQLDHGLKVRHLDNLFLAGQINGTTGYEEAAGQGLVAGINAAACASGSSPWYPDRSLSYLGVMVDDLVTQSVDEPYRMFTSRAENRLSLRYHNADMRLSPVAIELGLLGEEEKQGFLRKMEEFSAGRAEVSRKVVGGKKALDQLRRPEVSFDDLFEKDLSGMSSWPASWKIAFESEVKYEGYIQIHDSRSPLSGDTPIPGSVLEEMVPGISNEMMLRLRRANPKTFYEALQVKGVSPGALEALRMRLKLQKLSHDI
ncbi:MAG: tRNA uridine-5-carboxymethylaminomethyl(34) synthesis enzyme MnmG [Leptospirillum sp.]